MLANTTTHRLTVLDRLRRAVAFAEADLATLSERDWARLRADVAAVVGREVGIAKGPWLDRYTPSQWAELQAAVRGLLHQGADGRGPATLIGQDRDLALYVDPPAIMRAHLRPKHTRQHRQVVVIGSVRASLLVTLAILLAGAQGDAVRRCVDPKCERLFVGARAATFCSKRCRMRVYMAYERAGNVEGYKRLYQPGRKKPRTKGRKKKRA